jgi:redox-sensitive bicupin YhaK (pirin superfamily)
MIKIRKSDERGRTAIDWLDSYHSFSFGEYRDAKHTHFRTLRVINEDFVAAGKGFHPHPHADMEIITYVIRGELAHKDSLGNGSGIKPFEVQRMTAGTGITHSEFNNSKESDVHLLQIWFFPNEKSLKPGYEQKKFDIPNNRNKLTLVASEEGLNGSVSFNQDASMYACLLDAGKSVSHKIAEDYGIWLQLISGEVEVNGNIIEAGDAVSIENEKSLNITAKSDAHFIVFEIK